MAVKKRPAVAKPKGAPQAAPVNLPLAVAEIAPKPEWYDAADDKASLTNYLVTAAKLVNDEDAVADPPLKDPADISKADFQKALLDSLANPMYEKCGGRPRTRQVALDVYVGVKEGPRDAGHHHAGLSFYKQDHRFLPFKLAMRHRHGIATHWSTTHKKRWSIIRYLHVATPRKKVVDRRPLVWTRDDRQLNLAKESEEPFQAVAWNSKREDRVSEPVDSNKAKKRAFSKLDFSAMVLTERLKTPSGVLDHVMDKGTNEMKLWVHQRQDKLKKFIREAYELEGAKAKAALEKETEWQLIERLAKEGDCECGGSGCLWWALAAKFFENNEGTIDKERLAAAIRKVIMFGPSKDAPVPLITGAKNCAKSTVGDPLIKVFGEDNVLCKPKLGAPNGACGDLAKDNIRFVYWDDYRLCRQWRRMIRLIIFESMSKFCFC
jgi:hypothetical protein